jgi:hypothetical protein
LYESKFSCILTQNMALETILKRSLFTPPFIQTGNDKPRKPHWVGDKPSTPAQQGQSPTRPGGKDGDPSRPGREPLGYRELSSLTLGEVQDAYNYFKSQLLPSPYESWVATNYFCMLDLVRKRDRRPPVVFGRVKTCYPSDGYIHNIQDMELYFPNKNGKPDTLPLRAEDILLDPTKPVKSYGLRLKFFASPEDAADFDQHEDIFLEKGFIPEFIPGYIDLLDMNEHDHAAYPWLYVVGSRWLASIPESVHSEVRERLRSLIQWNKLVFNYHPERLPTDIRSLNRELGYKAGFTDIFLIEPETPQQTAQIVSSTFEKIFQQPIK